MIASEYKTSNIQNNEADYNHNTDKKIVSNSFFQKLSKVFRNSEFLQIPAKNTLITLVLLPLAHDIVLLGLLMVSI